MSGMATTAKVRARTESEPKPGAKSVFGKVRRSVTKAFGALAYTLGVLLYRWVLYPKRTPNQETLDALREVRERKGLTRYDSLEDFEKELDRA